MGWGLSTGGLVTRVVGDSPRLRLPRRPVQGLVLCRGDEQHLPAATFTPAWGTSFPRHAEEASPEHPSPPRPLSPFWAAGQRWRRAGLPAESQPAWDGGDSSCGHGTGLQCVCRCGARTGAAHGVLGLAAPAPVLLPISAPMVPGKVFGGRRPPRAGLGLVAAVCPGEELSAPCLVPVPGAAAGSRLTFCPCSTLSCPTAAPALPTLQPAGPARAERDVVAWPWLHGPCLVWEGLLGTAAVASAPVPASPVPAPAGTSSGEAQAGRRRGTARSQPAGRAGQGWGAAEPGARSRSPCLPRTTRTPCSPTTASGRRCKLQTSTSSLCTTGWPSSSALPSSGTATSPGKQIGCERRGPLP